MGRYDKDFTYFETEVSFKKSLSIQRELFKKAKFYKRYDLMADALENIKSEIKERTERKFKEHIEAVEKRLHWFRNLAFLYSKKTPNGTKVIYPQNIDIKKNKILTYCYEILLEIQNDMGLLT